MRLLSLASASLALLFSPADGNAQVSISQARSVQIQKVYGELPLRFEASRGQTGESAEFLSRGPGYALFLSSSQATLSLGSARLGANQELRMRLVGANPQAKAQALNPLPGKTNYYLGNDPKRWRTGIRSYAKVKYEQVYPGIDLIYYGNQRQLEYDFVVAPGEDPQPIHLEFEGAESLRFDSDGDLVIRAQGAEVKMRKPALYQAVADRRVEVAGGYRRVSANAVAFQVGSYDRQLPLVIDPVLLYSATLKGSLGEGQDVGNAIAVDAAGNAYITGQTFSSDFPTTAGAAQRTGTPSLYKSVNGGGAWASSSTGLLTSSVLSVAIDPITPSTLYAVQDSGLFKSTNSGATWTSLTSNLLGYHTGWQAVVVDPINPSNVYFGGVFRIFKSTAGGANLTFSFNGLTPNVQSLAIDPVTPTTLYAGTWAGGVYKTTNAGANWSPANAGISSYYVYALVVDPSNTSVVYAGIQFAGSNGGVYKTTNGGSSWSRVSTGLTNFDVQALVMDPSNSSVLYAGTSGGGMFKTTNGGASWTAANSGLSPYVFPLAVDPSNPSVVYARSGITTTKLFKTTDGGATWSPVSILAAANARTLTFDRATPANLYFGTAPGPDVFVTKLDPSGSTILFSTYLGGSSYDAGLGIAVDGSGGTYVTGSTTSVDFPTRNALQPVLSGGANSGDAFVAELDSTGNLVYSTYLGGQGDDKGYAIAVDASGSAYVGGSTGNCSVCNFPTANAFQSTYQGPNSDGFIAKLNPAGSALVFSTFLGGNGYDEVHGIAVDPAGNVYATGITQSTNFPTVNAYQVAFGGTMDAFVTKLSASGNTVLYSTYLGSSGDDEGFGIAVDGAGNAYVTGFTESPAFPVVNALQGFGGGRDAFVAKLNTLAAGPQSLVSSTFLGGSGNDYGLGITLDGSGNVYVGGRTDSSNFPLLNQASSSGASFVAKVNPATPALVYSTYVPGFLQQQVGPGVLGVDGSGNAYITGYFSSTSTSDVGVVKIGDLPPADLSITKSGTPDPVPQNANLTYTLSVTNNGPNPAPSVTVTDTLPAGATFVSSSASQGSCSGTAIVTCSLGTLTNGSAATITIVVRYATAGIKTNTATVTSSAPDPNTSNNSSSVSSTVAATADLSATMTGTASPVPVGTNFINTISVTNNGPSPATGVTVTDVLPAGVTFVAGNGCTGTTTITCTIGNIAVGSTLSVGLILNSNTAGTVTNSAAATGVEADPNTSNNTAAWTTTIVAGADLALTKSATPNPVQVGGNLTYTLGVSNGGPSGATGVTVTDTLPGGVTFVSASASQGSCSGSATVSCAIGTLASGASVTVTIVVTANAAGSVTNTASVTSTQTDPNSGNNTAAVLTTVSKATPTITWNNPADITYGVPLSNTQLNATASVAGSFAYTPPAGTVLNAGNGQTLSATFTPTDTANYNTATKTVFINVLKATPAITWANPVDITYGTALSATQLNATASVVGTFVYAPAAGTVLNAGNGQALSLTFTPTDAANYNIATKTVSINVLRATPTITWANPADITYGTALSGTQLNATASIAGTFVYAPAAGAVLNAGSGQTLSVTFTPTDAANYNTTTKSASLNVLKAAPTITWANPADITYGSALSGTQLNATASVAGAFAYSPGAGTVLNAGSGQALSVTFTPTDTTNYNTATKSVSINVLKATPTITWASPADIVYGTALSGIQLNATASVPGSFTYSPMIGTVLNAGNSQALSVTFTPSDTADYNSVSSSVSINVLKATPSITWVNPADIPYGTALSGAQLNATVSVPGTFLYTPSIGTVLNAGNGQTLSLTFIPSDTNDYNSTVRTVSINVLKATPVINWGTPTKDIFVTSYSTDEVLRYSGSTGAPLGAFVNKGSGGLSGPTGLIFGPDGNLYVASSRNGSVLKYNGTTGAFLAAFVPSGSGGLSDAFALAFGADRNLYVTNAMNTSADSVLKFDGNTGAFLGAFLTSADGLSNPLGLTFGPDGNLYVTNQHNAVQKFDSSTRALLRTFSSDGPTGITFGPDGNLYASDFSQTGTVNKVDLSSGAFNTFVSLGSGNLNFPIGLIFGPDGNLYVASSNNSSVLRYDGITGSFLDAFVPSASGGLSHPFFIAFAPSASGSNLADITYGTALSAAQLNATAPVPGSFTYTPPAGTVLNAGSGQSLSVAFTPTDTTNYNTATKSVSINVLKATPTITWANPVDISYGIALGGPQLNATASVPGSFAYSPAAGTVLNAGSGQTLSVTFTPTDTTNYGTATKSVSINVLRATPSITWANPADIIYGTALTLTQLNAAASVQGTFAYSPAAGTILNAGSGQPLSVTFTPTDTVNYKTATTSVSINVLKAAPTITWANPADITYGTALGATQLNATASVAGTFFYAPATGTVLNAGSGQALSVTFTPTDTTNYNTGTKSVSINVLKGTPTITWSNPADITYGTALSGTQLNASASVAGTFVYTPATGTVLNAGGQTLSVMFTPTDTANYNTATKTVSINVLRATPIITWANPADITYGTALSGAQLDASASVPGGFTYSPSAGTTLNAGNGQTLSVTFTPTDTTNYNPATKTVSINVLKATPTIAWSNPADITYGAALTATQLNATASVPGSFVYTPPAGTVPNAGGGQTLSVNFTPSDATNYSSASASVSINVLRATPTITWANQADITYGGALTATQLNATASVPGSLVYTPPIGTVLNAGGGQTLSVTFTPTDTTNYGTATKTVSINVLKATPAITWSNPADVTYGTALSGTQLNATASVAGAFIYSPSAGTILNAGNAQALSVNFTPTDTANYDTTSANVSINVLKATPAIAWSNPPDITYGTALSGTQLNATASVAGTFAYSPSAGTVLNTGSGQTVSVTFTPTDTANYTSVAKSISINVLKATPTITWSNPADIIYGTPLSGTQLNASTSVPGTLVYSPAAGALLTAGNGQILSVSFTPTDTANYTTASKNVVVNVLKATPAIIWTNPADIVYPTALSATQLNATSSIPGTLVYSPPAGTVLNPGNGQILSVAFTPIDTANYNPASMSVAINVLVNTPAGTNVVVKPVDTTTGKTPVTLTYSTVTQGGTTSLTTSNSGSPPPTGFKLGNPATYFQLNTTAVYSGSISICISYAGISVGNPSKLRLFHFDGAAWINVTTSNDTVNRIVCGTVTSLSPFAIFESAYSATVQQPISADGSSVFNANRGSVPVKFTLSLDGVSTCQLPPATIAVSRTSGTAPGPVNQSDYIQPSDTGINFRIDATACQYLYNLGTSSLGAGTYLVQIIISDVVVGSGSFGLQ